MDPNNYHGWCGVPSAFLVCIHQGGTFRLYRRTVYPTREAARKETAQIPEEMKPAIVDVNELLQQWDITADAYGLSSGDRRG